MHDGWRVALLALVLVLAGCGAQSGAGPTTTLTPVQPAEVTTRTAPTGESASLIVPGLSRARVVDPDALAAGHASTLRNTTFWFTYNRTVVAANGTRLRGRAITGNVGPGASDYYLVVTELSGDTTNRTVYRGNETNATVPLPVDPYFRDRLVRLFSSFERTAVGRPPPEVTGGIGTTYQVRASEFGPDGPAADEVRFRAIVEPAGIVMSYRLRYETTINGTRVTVREQLVHETVVFESFTERG